MTDITLRQTKGAPLTHDELDANFSNLKETADLAYDAVAGVGGKANAAALGVDAAATDLGTFTGATISDNATAKGALQELETALESTSGSAATKSNATAIGIAATDADMGEAPDQIYTPNGTARDWFEEAGSGISDVSQQRAMFKRSVFTEAPFYNTALLAAISTYGYDYLYPQGGLIDETAQELITLHCPSGGANSWSWFVVWDISDPDAMPLPAKTTFSYPTTQWRESVIVRSIGGVRYLEFLDNLTLVRVDIDTLPTDGSAVSAASTFAINCFPWITYDPIANLYLAGDGLGVSGGLTNKDLFLWRDGDDPTVITGKLRLPFLAVGSNRTGYIDKLPKAQGAAIFNGLVYVGEGGATGSTDSISQACGLSVVSQDGRLIASALSKQSDTRTAFSALCGRTVSLVENEGCVVSGGSLYAIWQTISIAERSLPIAQERGVVITQEMASGGVDFSAASQPAPNPFSIEEFERTNHFSSAQLTNPVTGDTLDTFDEIIDMMSQIGLQRYRFYGTNQVITDINGAAVTVTGRFVTFEMAGAAACNITIEGNPLVNRYWVAPLTGTRVQYATDGAGNAGFTPGATYAAGTVGAAIEARPAIVTPEQFGAIGNGVFNDYAAVQAALNALNALGGGTLLARKTYSIGATLRMDSNITIDMDGTGILRRDFNVSAGGAALIYTRNPSGQRGKNFAVKNGTLDGNGQNFAQTHNAFWGGSADGVRAENVTFLNNTGAHAMDFGDTTGLRAIDCRFLGYADKVGDRPFSEAIQTDPTGTNSDWVIERCYFGSNPANTDPDFGAWAGGIGNHAGANSAVTQRITIRDNVFEGMTYAAIRPFAWNDVSISDNKFINCAREIYAAVYNGAVPRGNADIAIAGNIFIGSVNNGIFFEDGSSGAVPTVGLTITGNTFKNASTCIRLQNVTDFAISGNKVKAALGFVNLVRCSAGSITGGTVSGVTSTNIYMSSTPGSDIAITGVTFSNLVGVRAVHINAAFKRIKVDSCLVVDCSGVNAFAADSAAENVSFNDNTVCAGALGLVPTTNAIITSASVVNPQIANNHLGAGVPVSSIGASAAGGLFVGSGAGSPESVVTAPIGSQWNDRTNGVQYMKKSGTGNTGWKLVTQAA